MSTESTESTESAETEKKLAELVEHFASHHLLHWIEALSLLGHVDVAIKSAQLATNWLAVSVCASDSCVGTSAHAMCTLATVQCGHREKQQSR